MLQKKPVKIEGRIVDGRYKKGVDKGAMSFQSVPTPLKPIEKKEPKDVKIYCEIKNRTISKQIKLIKQVWYSGSGYKLCQKPQGKY